MAEQESTEIFADGVDKTACSACGNVIDVAGVPPFTIVQCDKCKTKMAVPGMFGPYQLFKCLGKGGYGATYRGIEKFLKRPVAVKVIRSSCAKNEQVVEDFFREARILASLNHPNVAHVYSLGVHKEQPYIVMELVGGGRMDRLFRNKPLDETKALDIAIDVAEGLIATHDKDLVHGDVKPSNILLDESGTAKLVDFGMVRLGGDASTEGLAGTPYYISPEQAQNQKIDFRSDMYSLGATLFHSLTGRPPFEGQTVREVISARLEKPVPNLAAFRTDLCPQTCATIARMMAVNPADRYPTYQDMLSDLCESHRAASKRNLDPRYQAAAAGNGAVAAAAAPSQSAAAQVQPAASAAVAQGPRPLGAAKTARISQVQATPAFPLEKALPWIIIGGLAIIIGVVALVLWLAS
jgi:serine/threonine protein kinase